MAASQLPMLLERDASCVCVFKLLGAAAWVDLQVVLSEELIWYPPLAEKAVPLPLVSLLTMR